MLELDTIKHSDALEYLKSLPSDSVDCCVTSPPYWGLRDYGVSGQLGMENTFDEFLRKIIDIFSEVLRVLKPQGTFWLNMGDSYAGSGKGMTNNGTCDPFRQKTKGMKLKVKHGYKGGRTNRDKRFGNRFIDGLKPKNLIGQPWRVAFALQEIGWILRRDIIWHKPNPMPESCQDRPTTAHEYIFLLTKSQKYYYDAEAIMENCSPSTHSRVSQDIQAQLGSSRAYGGKKVMKAVVRQPQPSGWDSGKGTHGTIHREGRSKTVKYNSMNKNNSSYDAALQLKVIKRNKRSVWTVAPKPFKEAHFAVFPLELIEPCILAGCPEGGIVFDPFMGSGTTAVAAAKHGRNFIGSEINAEYIEIANKRIKPYLEQQRLSTYRGAEILPQIGG